MVRRPTFLPTTPLLLCVLCTYLPLLLLCTGCSPHTRTTTAAMTTIRSLPRIRFRGTSGGFGEPRYEGQSHTDEESGAQVLSWKIITCATHYGMQVVPRWFTGTYLLILILIHILNMWRDIWYNISEQVSETEYWK